MSSTENREVRTETSVELGRRVAGRAEARMLIDGELAHAATGEAFDNVSPVTGLVLGQTAAAGVQDMDRGIAAARRAFDESDWSTNRALRKRCLEQLQSAIEADKEALREELIAEVGCPVMITQSAQLDWPLAEALRYPGRLIDEFEWERTLEGGVLFGERNVRTDDRMSAVHVIFLVEKMHRAPSPRVQPVSFPKSSAIHASALVPRASAWA